MSVVIPCLNEARTLDRCIVAARKALADEGLTGEVIVADNGSQDASRAIARRRQAKVVEVSAKGYGRALRAGIEAARGRYVIMGDADLSYDFGQLPILVAKLREGFDLVIGNRFQGGVEKGAMPALNRWVGNPVLSLLGRILFRTPVGDFHCGLRGLSLDAYRRLDLRTTGMEFASEMVVKASLKDLRVAEVPVVLRKDQRDRPPHLRAWRDGWRHLRFMLLLSPRWLFLIPGLATLGAGACLSLWLIISPRRLGPAELDIHTLLVAGLLCLLGYQQVQFAVFAKVLAIREGLHPPHPALTRMFRYITLETGLAGGAVMLLLGGSILTIATWMWEASGFGPLDPRSTMRAVIPAVILIALGSQTIFASFFLSTLGIEAEAADSGSGLDD